MNCHRLFKARLVFAIIHPERKTPRPLQWGNSLDHQNNFRHVRVPHFFTITPQKYWHISRFSCNHPATSGYRTQI